MKGGKRAFSERQREGGLITILCFSLFSVSKFVIGFADLGTSPQTPGIYRFHAKTRFRREHLSSLPLSWPPARRSGRFPPLPYPPAGPYLFYVFFMRGASKVERERFFPNGLGNFGVLAGCMSMEKISPWARHGAVLP